jgi:F-type H+-transporting ATPase subunit alpha
MKPARLNNLNIREVGKITSLFSGVAKIQGLEGILVHELLIDDFGNPAAIVIGFTKDSVEALFFDENFDFTRPVFPSGRTFSIPVGENYIGKIVSGRGQEIKTHKEIAGKYKPVFGEAPQIIERQQVKTPLSTGIKMIDSTLPLGRGQRELIIGDRKLGKTTITTDVVLNQQGQKSEVLCVYVVCGKKKRELEKITSLFEKEGAFSYTAIVAATADSSLAEQYLAPFVGTTIAEYFRDKGKDALIIYDDLTNHAKAYRDISLLLKRPPGREVYPGDIFSVHAKLLERSAQLSKDRGGGSLSSLPIVETQEGDLTAYITTNLISITDGQIYLERDLFQKRFLPAINIGLSVSRVGSKAQPAPLKDATKALRLSLAQQRELQKLIQLETTISEETKKKLKRGNLILAMLNQEKHTNITWQEQTLLFYAVNAGLLDDIDADSWRENENFFLALLDSRYKPLLSKIEKDGITKNVEEEIVAAVNDFRKEFITKNETIS